MRSLEPTIPAPSGKFSGLPEYIEHAIKLAGSAYGLSNVLGFSNGTRVSDYRKSFGYPSVLNALKLARFTGDDPVDVLTMAGHADVVEELNKVWGKAHSSEAAHLAQLETKMKLDELIYGLQRVAGMAEQNR